MLDKEQPQKDNQQGNEQPNSTNTPKPAENTDDMGIRNWDVYDTNTSSLIKKRQRNDKFNDE